MAYNLPQATYDETYDLQKFIFPFSLTGAEVEMRVYKSNSKLPLETYTTSDNLEIDTENDKILNIKEHIITIEPGIYNYKIRVTIEGKRRTYLTGNWSIVD